MMIQFRDNAHRLASLSAKKLTIDGGRRGRSRFRRGRFQTIARCPRLQLNRTGIRATTVDPSVAETEFSVVRFKCDVARAKKVYEGTRPLAAEDIAAKINAPLHI